MSNPLFDAVVVGAGLAGSASAAALARLGWNVLLVEQDSLPRHKVCGEFLSPDAQASLRELGLDESVSKLHPAELYHAELTSPRGQSLRTALPGHALGVSRYALDAALASAAHARGVTLWTATSVLDFRKDGQTYVLHLRSRGQASRAELPECVRARLIILAAGRHNRLTVATVGDSLSATRDAAAQQYVGIKCHFSNVDVPKQVELYFFDGGYAGINPIENGRANFCMLTTYEAFQQQDKSPTAMLDAVREQHPTLQRRLGAGRMLPDTLKTVAAVTTSQPATPWRGAPCVGDAAAMITPLCGDGMAMALRSAELCAPLADSYLREQISEQELAQSYTRHWHSEFDQRLRVGRLLQTALAKPVLADVMLGLGRVTPPLVSYLVHATRGPRESHAA